MKRRLPATRTDVPTLRRLMASDARACLEQTCKHEQALRDELSATRLLLGECAQVLRDDTDYLMTERDIAAMLGISQQMVNKLIRQAQTSP